MSATVDVGVRFSMNDERPRRVSRVLCQPAADVPLGFAIELRCGSELERVVQLLDRA